MADSSSPGQTASPLAKRMILFGDGYASLENNPTANPITCYQYPGSGIFPVVMEVTDTKGCYARDYDTVTIYHDAPAAFSHTLTDLCDSIKLCVKNQTSADPSNLQGFYWDFGDGTVDSVNWNPPCHWYRDSGTYSVSLVVLAGNSCIDTLLKKNLIHLNPIRFQPHFPVKEACFGSSFSMSDQRQDKDTYTWFYSLQNSAVKDSFGYSPHASLTPDKPGNFLIFLKGSRGKCKKEILADTLRVNGPLAGIAARNAALCIQGDTTYFCDNSNYTNTYGIKRLWTFGDHMAASCTTSVAQNLNPNGNCNHSTDGNTQHLYTRDSCYFASLWLIDTVTGCQHVANRNVLVGDEGTLLPIGVSNQKACTGSLPDRTFYFNVPTCGEYMLNPDSAGGAGFQKGLYKWNYKSKSHPQGYVTLGVILLRSDTAALCPGFSSGPPCTDTVWYHHYFQLMDEPAPVLENMMVCPNTPGDFQLQDTSGAPIRKVEWDWGDGKVDSLILQPGDTLPELYHHTFTQKGLYKVTVSLENTRYCVQTREKNISVGHFASKIGNPVLCQGACSIFEDSIAYYGDTNQYWGISGRPEKLYWIWGDGTTDSIHNPVKCFPQIGSNQAMLISIDSMGCADTLQFQLNVGGVKAGIETPKGKVLCSEIVQMFDSSMLLDPLSGEKIIDYSWNFSDGSRLKKIQDPFHFYSSFGEFDIWLKVKTDRGCTDSTKVVLEVLGPKPAFEFVTDTVGCYPLTVEMKNISTQCVNWIWYFGDPNNTTLPTKYDSNVVFTYNQPGVYYLKLYGADSIFNQATNNKQFCSATYPDTTVQGQIAKKVVVLNRPSVDFIIPEKVCVDEPFWITSQANLRYNQHNWDFGDGQTKSTNARIFSWEYNEGGTYTIQYTPTYPPDPVYNIACYDSASKTIEVIDIKAGFEIDSAKSGPLDYQFINTSVNAVGYEWTFMHLDSGTIFYSTDKDPYHRMYPDQGYFKVCLKARNERGCIDTLCKTWYRRLDPYIFIPNVFTPGDRDRINDAFDIDIRQEVEYHSRIYNRFGQLVYESETDGDGNDGINWNGYLPDGSEAPAGVYYIIFRYRFYYRQEETYHGTITLIR